MRKPIKYLSWIFGLILIFFLLSIATLPILISSPRGTKIALKWVNQHIKGSISVDNVELNWVGPQRLDNFQYKDSQGRVLFSCLSCETNTSLFYMLMGGRTFGRTVLEEPYLYLSSKTLSKEKEAAKTQKKKKKRPVPQFDDTLMIMHGTVILAPENSSPITISEIHLNKTAAPDHLVLRALTSQKHVQGLITAEAKLKDNLYANIHVQDFPIEIFDSLSNSKLYTEALGQALNVDLQIEQNPTSDLFIKGALNSTNLKAAIEGSTENNRFILSPKTHLEFTATPSFFKQLIDEKQRGNWELASKTQIALQIEKGSFPYAEPLDFKEVVLQANAKVDRAELQHVSLGSYSLKSFDALVTAHNNLEIKYQGEIQGKEATKLGGNISITPSKEILFDYECEGFPVTLLGLVSDELEKKVRLLIGNNFNTKGQGTWAAKVLDAQIDVDSHDVKFRANVAGKKPEFHFEVTGTHQIHGSKAKVLGKSLNFNLNGAAKSQEGSMVIPFLKGKVFNPYFDLDVSGQLGEEGKPLTLHHVQLSAMGSLKKLPIEENLPEDALQNGILYLHVDGAKNRIICKAESKKLKTHVEIQNFIQSDKVTFSQADINFACNLQDFPVVLANPFVGEDVDLTPFLGKTLTLASKGRYTPNEEPRISLDLNAQGTGFSTDLSFTLDGALTVKQNKPSYVYWVVTPERYAALMRLFRLEREVEPTFILTHPTEIELNIKQFTCPTKAKENLSRFLCQSGFVGDIKVGTTIFRSKQTNEPIAFQGISGSIRGENFSEKIDVSLSGAINASNLPKSEASTFSFVGQMFNFWTKQGKFNREGLTVKGELGVDLLPVRQILGIVPLDHETRAIVQAILGDFVNARIHGEISKLTGPVTIDVKSSNFKALLPLQLQKNALYLRDYVEAEITLTKAVDETLLRDITPLITGAYSDHPIKVYIDPEGFVLPIRPYSLEKVQIGKAIVDIGNIKVKNGGQIQSLMQFLNAKEITPDGVMEAWFTPIFLNLHHGVATYKRFDALLARKVHIAMWGSINLINQKVKMTLAIAPTTLYERFKITGLTKKDMFQVKMRGTTSKLDLDWSSAYSRIAWIVARSSAGYLSDILGGILEQLVSSSDEDSAPPATTDPLPWESLYPSEQKRK